MIFHIPPLITHEVTTKITRTQLVAWNMGFGNFGLSWKTLENTIFYDLVNVNFLLIPLVNVIFYQD